MNEDFNRQVLTYLTNLLPSPLIDEAVLTFDKDTGEISWKAAPSGGGASWDATLTVASPITFGQDVDIPDWTIPSLPFGFYEFEIYGLVTGGASGLSSAQLKTATFQAGDWGPQFTGSRHYWFEGDKGSESIGVTTTGSNQPNLGGAWNDVQAGIKGVCLLKGMFTHHEWATSNGNRVAFAIHQTSLGDGTFEAGSYFRYRLIQAYPDLLS